MKLRLTNHYLLTCGALIVAVLCVLSVSSPVRFQHEQAKRETAVKGRLLKIRIAEEHYRQAHGVYTADFSKLTHSHLLADSLQYIPFASGKRFDLAASTIIGKSGRQIPVMECGASYDAYLDGLDQNTVANLIKEANVSGRYPGLKIGDITEPNNNAGNWE
jgi:hypothetical protein